jgi:hypothetical protein
MKVQKVTYADGRTGELCQMPYVEFSEGPSWDDWTDRPGGDYRDFAQPSGTDWSLCRDTCASDARCRAYTWVKYGIQGPAPHCWLKSSIPPAQKNDCCTSGVVRGSNPVSGAFKEGIDPKVRDVIGDCGKGMYKGQDGNCYPKLN